MRESKNPASFGRDISGPSRGITICAPSWRVLTQKRSHSQRRAVPEEHFGKWAENQKEKGGERDNKNTQ